MPPSPESTQQLKAPLGTSSLENWPSFLENSPGGTTPPTSPASRLERIVLWLRSPRGLVVACICWLLLVLAAVFGFTLLTSWEPLIKVSAASSTAASLWEKGSDGWMVRKRSFYLPPPLDDSTNTLWTGRLSLKYEMEQEVRLWNS